MSYTELYKFKKDGNAESLGEIKNALRGAMLVWGILDKRYLEPLPKPTWMSQQDYNERGYSRCSAMFDPNAMKEIWGIAKREEVSRVDKIVLSTTFDRVIVKRENIEETIKAFRDFEGETSLKEQADILEEALKDKDLIAVAWNQTSVNGDTWTNFGDYNEETEEYESYNILTDNDHWELFEDLTVNT